MDDAPKPTREDVRPLEMSALRALAHPLRVQLLNTLTTYGPATASGLAERLGESSGATSYHLRQLEKHGFVLEDTSRGNARERWWKRVPGPVNIDTAVGGEAERAASQLIVSEWQRDRERLVRDYLTHAVDRLDPVWLEASMTSSAGLRLTSSQLAELSRALGRVVDEYVTRYRGQDGPGTRPVQAHVDVFPVVDAAPTPGSPSVAADTVKSREGVEK